MFQDFLQDFFSLDDIGRGFRLGSADHLLASLVFAVIPMALIYLFRNRLHRWKHEGALGIGMGVLGLLVEFLQYYWHYYGGETDWRLIYPTTLCGLTLYVSSLAMITRSVDLAKIAYFFSFGAFFSFAFADISHGYDRFRFYAFFIIHGLILCNAVYLIAVHRIRADRKGLRDSCLLMLLALILSYLLNVIFSDSLMKMNFFYLNFPPFEFPFFSWLYGYDARLYSAVAGVCYFLLLLIMYGLAKLFRFDRFPIRSSAECASGRHGSARSWDR